jgi:hypothetical protein
MSTFYLLPSRPMVGKYLVENLKPLLTSLLWTDNQLSELAEILESAVDLHPDVFVIYRDELPEGEISARALADGFGVEPNDVVIDVQLGKTASERTTQHWRLTDAA